MKYFALIFVVIAVYSCDETVTEECPDNASCIEPESVAYANLATMRNEILELLALSNSCADAEACTFVGLGSKPCGGPWEYIVYNSTSDVAEGLEERITQYNDTEASLNETYGRGSDCAVANPPDSVVCDGGGCIAYYQEQAFTGGVCCN